MSRDASHEMAVTKMRRRKKLTMRADKRPGVKIFGSYGPEVAVAETEEIDDVTSTIVSVDV